MRVCTGASGFEERKAAEEDMAMAVPTTSSSSSASHPNNSSTRLEEAGRMPSIEMEPKTLTLDQIKYAREAALYVVSTKTEEEALQIFTTGLKPVRVQVTTTPVRKSSSVDSSDDDVDLDGSCYYCHDGGSRGGGCGRRHGRRKSSIDDDIRDIATAPF